MCFVRIGYGKKKNIKSVVGARQYDGWIASVLFTIQPAAALPTKFYFFLVQYQKWEHF